MYIPIFSETASPQKKIDEIRSIFLLAQKQIRKKIVVALPTTRGVMFYCQKELLKKHGKRCYRVDIIAFIVRIITLGEYYFTQMMNFIL